MIRACAVIILWKLFKFVATNWPILVNLCNSAIVSKWSGPKIGVRNYFELYPDLFQSQLHLRVLQCSIWLYLACPVINGKTPNKIHTKLLKLFHFVSIDIENLQQVCDVHVFIYFVLILLFTIRQKRLLKLSENHPE